MENNNGTKVYVASAFKNRLNVRSVMNNLESKGFVISHDWTHSQYKTEQPDWTNINYIKECALDNVEGVKDADVVVVIMNDPNELYRGTRSEIGMAIGLNKPVYLYKPTLIDIYDISLQHPNILVFTELSDLLSELESVYGI